MRLGLLLAIPILLLQVVCPEGAKATEDPLACVPPSSHDRTLLIPDQHPLPGQGAECEPMFRKIIVNGIPFCVEPCPEGFEGPSLFGSPNPPLICRSECPKGTFPLSGIDNVFRCFSCNAGKEWLPALQLCCGVTPVTCANVLRLGPASIAHLTEGTTIRVVQVSEVGGVEFFDREEEQWLVVEVGDVFGPCTKVRTGKDDFVIWERAPEANQGKIESQLIELGELTDPAPFDLENGSASLQQFGTCSVQESCGFNLTSGHRVLMPNTKETDSVGITVDDRSKAGSLSVRNQPESSQDVVITLPSGESVISLPPGQEIDLLAVPTIPTLSWLGGSLLIVALLLIGLRLLRA